MDYSPEFQLAFLSQAFHLRRHTLGQLSRREGFLNHLNPPRFDPGQVEQIIDERK